MAVASRFLSAGKEEEREDEEDESKGGVGKEAVEGDGSPDASLL